MQLTGAGIPLSRARSADLSRPVLVVAALFLLLTGTGIGLLITGLTIPTPLERTSPSGSIAVELEPYTDDRSVTLTPLTSQPREILAPESGVLTGHDCVEGKAWESGTFPIQINAVPRLAIHTEVPLWRDLTWGDHGPDINALQAELGRLGFAVSSSGIYDSKTVDAVKDLLARAAVPNDGTLPRTSYVWIPSSATQIASCAAQLGSDVTAGSAVATQASSLVSIEVGYEPKSTEGVHELTVGTITIPVSADLIVTDPVALESVAATPEFRTYMASKGEVPFTGRLRLSSPIDVAGLPPTAVLVDGHTACAISGGIVVPVEILDSSLGRTIVRFQDTVPSNVQTPVTRSSCS